MAGGYNHRPDGSDGAAGLIKGLQRQIDALRSGAGIKSSILRNAQLLFQDEDGNTSGIFGHRDATRLQTDGSIVSEAADGAVFFDPSGGILFLAQKYEATGDTLVQAGTAGSNADLDLFRVFTADFGINADDVDINSSVDASIRADERVYIQSELGLVHIDHSTTGAAANAAVAVDGTFYRVVSGRKYKADIAAAVVDHDDALALLDLGRTWVDKAKIDSADEGDITRNVGFIAEELDEHPSLRQFVNYDEDGNPDSIEYDRLSVALLAVIKDQQARLDSIEERLTNLEGDRT